MRETLKTLREKNKKTLAEVAKVLEISKRTAYAYEQGTRAISVEKVVALAEFFGEKVEDVIEASINTRRSVL